MQSRVVDRRGWVRWVRWAGGICAVLVAGCAPTVQLSRPSLDIPAAFSTASDPDEVAQAAADVHWRQFFRDPRLHALIEAALVYNRDLRQATARVEEARAQMALVQADRLPSINLLGQGRVDRTFAENISTGPERRLDLGLSSVSYELDFFGRVASLTAAARANYLATDEARRVAELSLIAQVAEIYYAQRHTEELLGRARQTVASRTESLAILDKARHIGMAYDLELEQAQVLLEGARAQRAQLGHMQNQTQNLLRLLTGAVDQALPDPSPLDLHGLNGALATGVPAEVLLLRPDVRSAEQRLAASQASIAAARAAFFPRITLTAGLGVASAGLAGLFKAGAWAFQPSLAMPLFDGGRNQASLDLAKAREVGAVAQYEKTVQQAFREVADQLSARASLSAQAGAAQRVLQAQHMKLQIHRQRHAGGLSGYLEVLEAEREVLAAQQSLTQVQRAQIESVIGLYKALGGGAAVGRPASVALQVAPVQAAAR